MHRIEPDNVLLLDEVNNSSMAEEAKGAKGRGAPFWSREPGCRLSLMGE